MIPLQRDAREHRLNPGDLVIELTATREDGTVRRELFRYDTGAQFWADDMQRLGHKVTNWSRVEWDGLRNVDFYGGD